MIVDSLYHIMQDATLVADCLEKKKNWGKFQISNLVHIAHVIRCLISICLVILARKKI